MLSREQFINLVQPCRHRRDGLPDWLGARGVATCFLSYCCGLWFPEIAALGPHDWCPDGEPFIVVTGARTEKRDAALATRPRCVPVPPAVQWAVERYQECAPASEHLFSFADQDGDRGRTLKSQVTLALRRTGLAAEGVNAGALRSSFETFVRTQDTQDGLVDYLIGATADVTATDRWAEESPPLDLLRRVLKRALPVWKVDRAYWQAI